MHLPALFVMYISSSILSEQHRSIHCTCLSWCCLEKWGLLCCSVFLYVWYPFWKSKYFLWPSVWCEEEVYTFVSQAITCSVSVVCCLSAQSSQNLNRQRNRGSDRMRTSPTSTHPTARAHAPILTRTPSSHGEQCRLSLNHCVCVNIWCLQIWGLSG